VERGEFGSERVDIVVDSWVRNNCCLTPGSARVNRALTALLSSSDQPPADVLKSSQGRLAAEKACGNRLSPRGPGPSSENALRLGRGAKPVLLGRPEHISDKA